MSNSKIIVVQVAVLVWLPNLATAETVPPSSDKQFYQSSVGVGGTTTLVITVTNQGSTDYNALTFTDSLPAGLVIATPNEVFTGCTPGSSLGTITAPAGGNTISVAPSKILAALPSGGGKGDESPPGSCEIGVNVTGTTPGSYTNTVSATDPSAGTGNTATASITVLPGAPPMVMKAFATDTLPTGGTTTLTFTLTALNALTNTYLVDFLPDGLVIATPAAINNTCGGKLQADPGGTFVFLQSVSFAGPGSCTLTVNVTGVTAAAIVNSVTASDAVLGAGNTSTATLNVNDFFFLSFFTESGGGGSR